MFKIAKLAGKDYLGSISNDFNQIKSTLGSKFGSLDKFSNTFDQRVADGLTDLLSGATGIRTSSIPDISEAVMKAKQQNRMNRQATAAGLTGRAGRADDDPSTGIPLKYPEKFFREDGEADEMTNFIHFRSLPRKNRRAGEKHYDIFLYVPNTLSDAINVAYTEAEKDLTAEAVAAIFPLEGDKWFSSSDISREELETIMMSGAPAGDFIKKTTGRTINPLKFQLFKGVNMRTYTYNFEFRPTSRAESERIRHITYAFRKSMLPGTMGATSRAYTFPHEWKIDYHGPISQWIDRPMKTACTTATVNWAPNGFKTHMDGSPTTVTLALTFTELLTLDRNRYDERAIGGDVKMGADRRLEMGVMSKSDATGLGPIPTAGGGLGTRKSPLEITIIGDRFGNDTAGRAEWFRRQGLPPE